jgi:hypothetical protein
LPWGTFCGGKHVEVFYTREKGLVDFARAGHIPDVFTGTFPPLLNWKKLLMGWPCISKVWAFPGLFAFSPSFLLAKKSDLLILIIR